MNDIVIQNEIGTDWELSSELASMSHQVLQLGERSVKAK